MYSRVRVQPCIIFFLCVLNRNCVAYAEQLLSTLSLVEHLQAVVISQLLYLGVLVQLWEVKFWIVSVRLTIFVFLLSCLLVYHFVVFFYIILMWTSVIQMNAFLRCHVMKEHNANFLAISSTLIVVVILTVDSTWRLKGSYAPDLHHILLRGIFYYSSTLVYIITHFTVSLVSIIFWEESV